jgi:hypothetical protein
MLYLFFGRIAQIREKIFIPFRSLLHLCSNPAILGIYLSAIFRLDALYRKQTLSTDEPFRWKHLHLQHVLNHVLVWYLLVAINHRCMMWNCSFLSHRRMKRASLS